MAKESINPDGLSVPAGPYVHVTTAPPGGTLVFCAGEVAFDPAGQIVGVGDVVAQAERTLENLALALAAGGATFADVTKITMYMVDVSDYPKVAPVRARYLSDPFPASALIGVKELMYPDLLIEIDAIAVVHD